MIEYSYFQNTILLASLYWFKFIVESACILFLNEDVPEKKAKINAEGDFYSLHQSAIYSRKYS